MNREQRRHQQQRKGISATPLQPQKQCSINYGHNGQQVVMMFTTKIENLVLTERQVDEMVEALRVSNEKLMAHKAAAAREGGPGHG